MACACSCSRGAFLCQNPLERLDIDVIGNVGNWNPFHGIFEQEANLSALSIVESVLVCGRECAIIFDDFRDGEETVSESMSSV